MNTCQVVVGFNFSHSGKVALSRALALASRAPFHTLHFVCVIDPHSPIDGIEVTNGIDYVYAERVQKAVTAEVELELRNAKVAGNINFLIHARFGKPAEEILAVARDVGAELVIVGSKGVTGMERLLLGSVAEQVVREAECTVEVARPPAYPHVELSKIIDVEPHLTYVPPHRYSYEENRLQMRPLDWPLY